MEKKMTLEADVYEYAQAKEQAKALAVKMVELEKNLVANFRAGMHKTIEIEDGAVKATLVEGSRVVTDADKLEAALSPAQWKSITKPVLDKEKLEAMIVIGKIDKSVVAAASEEKDSKPYILVSGSTRGVQPPSVIGVKARKRSVKVPAKRP
jgi:hypothetical protein